MDIHTYSAFHTLLNDLDYTFLITTATQDKDPVLAAIAWDGMNLIVSSVGQAMSDENLQEGFNDYDGYRPYYLNNDGKFQMVFTMYDFIKYTEE